MHDYYFFNARVFLGSGVILTRRVTSLIDLYWATGGIGQLKIHENEKTSFSGNRWTKGNLPTSSSVNPTAQLIHVVDGVSLAQTSKEVRFEVWSWWMEKNRQIASRTDKGSSTGLMIVREHLGTLLIAGERERERNGSIIGSNYCYPATVFHSSGSERINVFADSINAELEVQLNGPCPDYAQIMCR